MRRGQALDRGQALRAYDIYQPPKRTAAHPEHRWCDHCCHVIAHTPVKLPVGFPDPRRKTCVTCKNLAFCSKACALGYFVHEMKAYPPGAGSHFAGVVPAPPRAALADFGGFLTIEEFRGATESYVVLPPKMLATQMPLARKAYTNAAPTTTHTKRSTAAKPRSLTFDNVPRNETLRLKRPKKTFMDRLAI